KVGGVERAIVEQQLVEHYVTYGIQPPFNASTRKPTLDQQLEMLRKHADLEVLSRPQIRTVMGQPASIQIGSAASKVSYFVRTGEKTFELKEATFDAPLGISFDVTPRAVEGDPDRIEISPLKICTTTLDGREPVAGVDLQIGKPIVSVRKL